MKRIAFLLMMFIGLAPTLKAQTLRGIVKDASGNPLSYVNIVELSQSDSTFQKGTVSGDDGSFSMNNIKSGNLLRISYLGYDTQFIPYTGQDFIAVQLKESEEMLGEVVVKSQLPKTVLSGEGMSTTVAGSVLEKTASMEQLLSRIPYVSASNGEIEVFGRGTPEIYINGRKMRDKMELERLQPNEIKKVEVINNPGARYDASIKSVIRITTKKPVGEGLGIDTKTTMAVNEQKRTSGTENLRLNYRNGGFDLNAQLYGAYTHGQENNRQTYMSYLANTWVQTNDVRQERTSGNPYARLAASYQFAENQSVGASVSYNRIARNGVDGTMTSTTQCDDLLTEQSLTDFSSPTQAKSFLANTYYNGMIGKIGIDFDADYYWYALDAHSNDHETYQDTESETKMQDISSIRRNYSNLFASKLVFNMPVLSGSFSVGGEYSISHRKSHYTTLPENIVNNENSRIREGMTSAFIDYSRAFGRVSLQAGLRYEHIHFVYYDNGQRMDAQCKDYGNWFPSLALSWPVGKTQMQLTYASDIYRPTYNELRDGIQYNNRYTYESGNPFLVPSISRNLGYALSWKWIEGSLMYTHISDEVCSIAQMYQDDPKVSLLRPENINSYNSFQAGLSLRPSFGFWHPVFEVLFYKQWLNMDTHEGSTLNNPVGVFQLTNTFDLKWCTASVVMTAQTEGNMGNKYIRQGYFNTDLSIYKSLLKDRLTFTLDVNDMFGTADQHRSFYSGSQRTLLYDVYSSSAVTLSIRYRFNATNSKYKGTGAGQSQKNRM